MYGLIIYFQSAWRFEALEDPDFVERKTLQARSSLYFFLWELFLYMKIMNEVYMTFVETWCCLNQMVSVQVLR